MKKQEGITLITLIVSMLAMCIVLGILGNVVQNFYKNTSLLEKSEKYMLEISRFNGYFIEDVKSNKQAQVTKNKITFEDGTTYQFAENSIYRNKVKISKAISYCVFSSTQVSSGGIEKQVILVNVGTQANTKFENEYVLRYW